MLLYEKHIIIRATYYTRNISLYEKHIIIRETYHYTRNISLYEQHFIIRETYHYTSNISLYAQHIITRETYHYTRNISLYEKLHYTSNMLLYEKHIIIRETYHYTSNISFQSLIVIHFFNENEARRPSGPRDVIVKGTRDMTWCQWPRGLRRWSAAARLLRLWVRIPPGACLFVCCECCVLSGRVLCDGLITRPVESYRLWCVLLCDLETSRMRRPLGGCCAKTHKQTNVISYCLYMENTK